MFTSESIGMMSRSVAFAQSLLVVDAHSAVRESSVDDDSRGEGHTCVLGATKFWWPSLLLPATSGTSANRPTSCSDRVSHLAFLENCVMISGMMSSTLL